MSDYGLNFGFRRSGGDAIVREGRYRVPATGVFRQGDLVTIDTANPGYLKLAGAGVAMVPGVTGLLVQEFELDSIYEAGDIDSHTRGKAKNGYLATIWAGQGIKVWYRNTAAQTRWDGRSISAVTRATLTNVAVGDDLAWDGAKWIEQASSAASVLRVLSTDASTYVEAVTLA